MFKVLFCAPEVERLTLSGTYTSTTGRARNVYVSDNALYIDNSYEKVKQYWYFSNVKSKTLKDILQDICENQCFKLKHAKQAWEINFKGVEPFLKQAGASIEIND